MHPRASCHCVLSLLVFMAVVRLMSLPEDQGEMGLAVLVVDTYCSVAGGHPMLLKSNLYISAAGDADLPHKALGA
jgi:hypothetical protein